MFLLWLANGASCRVVSRVFGMTRSTVHCSVTESRRGGGHSAQGHRGSISWVFRADETQSLMKAAGAIEGCRIQIASEDEEEKGLKEQCSLV